MADLMGKLGQQIKGSVGNFGAGLKSAAIAGNPALFGALATGIEKGFDNLGKELKADREERKKDRQFDEEKTNEQNKVFNEIRKSLEGIKNALEKMGLSTGKNAKGEPDTFFEMVIRTLIAALASLNTVISDAMKAFSGWAKSLGEAAKGPAGKALAGVEDLIKAFNDALGKFIDNIKNSRFGQAIGDIVTDLSKFFSNIFERFKNSKFGTLIDDGIKTIRGFLSGVFDDVVKGLKRVFDLEFDFLKNLKIPGFDDIKGKINKGVATIIEFFDTVGKYLAEIPGLGWLSKIGPGLSKFVKAIPVIGNLIMVIEGIFEAFDTESLAQSLQKAQKDINYQDRLIGFFGGMIGSFFGILDLLVLGIKALFNIDLAFADGETFQKKATRLITGFIYDFFAYFDGLFKVIGGLLTLDTELMKKGLQEMELIVEDWLVGFKNFFGSILKVPFAKMTNAVASAVEYMVNGIIEGMNLFVGFILDLVGKIPGASGIAERAKNALKVQKISVGRMDETPYKKEVSRRAENYRTVREREDAEKAAKAKQNLPPTTTGTSERTSTGSTAPANLDQLSESQKQTALRIYNAFRSAGFSDIQAQAAVANAWAESRFDPKASNVTTTEASYGLFQMNRMGGLGQGYSPAELMDADKNISLAIQAANKSRNFLNAKTAEEATRIFSLEIERPAGGLNEAQRRANMLRSINQAVGIGKQSSAYSADYYDKAAFNQGPYSFTSPNADNYLPPYAFPDFTGGVRGYSAQRVSPTSVATRNNWDLLNTTSLDIQDKQLEVLTSIRDTNQGHYTYIVQNNDEELRFRQERAGYENEFFNTMRNMYRDMLRDVIKTRQLLPGEMEGRIFGGGRALTQSVLGQPLDKLGKKLFGDQYGGQMGAIFTRLAGSYVEQFAASMIGGMFGVEQNAVQKGMYALARGDKQGFFQELIFGRTGVPLTMEQAIGGPKGLEQLAKDLAEVTGMPFSPLFSLGGPDNMVSQDPSPFGGFRVVINDAGQTFYNYVRDAGALWTQGITNTTSDYRQSYYTSGTVMRDAYGRPMGAMPGSPGFVGPMQPVAGTAAGRIGNTFLNVAATYAGQKIGGLGGSNPYARMFLQSGATGGLRAVFGGGDFVQGIGKGLGFELEQGLSIFQGMQAMYDAFSGGLLNASAKVAEVIGDMGLKMAKMGSQGGLLNSAGNAIANYAGKFADVGIGYMAGSTINQMISGGKSMGGTMDTIQKVGVAAASFFFGPIGGAIAGAIGGLLNAAFGHGPTEVKDYGLTGTLAPTTTGQTYVQKHQEGGWFSSDKNWTEYSAADPKMLKALGNTVQSIQKAVKESGRAFRFQDVEDTARAYEAKDFGGGLFGGINAAVMNFTGQQYKSANLKYKEAFEKLLTQDFKKQFTLSLKGKSEEEQKEALENLLKDYTDEFIRAAFGDLVDRFKKEGERLSETFDRLAGATLKFNEVANKLGYDFQNLTGIVDLLELADFKDKFIELSGGAEKFLSDASFLFDKFYTEEEKLIFLQEEGQRKAREALIDSGLEGLYTVEGLTEMAGNNFEEARLAYRKLRDDFIEQNKELLASNDPTAVKQLAYINGELAQSYYLIGQATSDLNEIQNKSAEALKAKWLELYGVGKTLSATAVASGTGNIGVTATAGTGNALNPSSSTSTNVNNISTQMPTKVDNSTNTTIINENVSATEGGSNRVISMPG